MRWHWETQEERAERRKEWSVWFAWRPVHDHKNGYTMWLENVLRKCHDDDFPLSSRWRYRPVTILEEDLGMQPQPKQKRTIKVRLPQPSNYVP